MGEGELRVLDGVLGVWIYPLHLEDHYRVVGRVRVGEGIREVVVEEV